MRRITLQRSTIGGVSDYEVLVKASPADPRVVLDIGMVDTLRMSPSQARRLAECLLEKADEIDTRLAGFQVFSHIRVNREPPEKAVAMLKPMDAAGVAGEAGPKAHGAACAVCGDSHRMVIDGVSSSCTFCPKPCQGCKAPGHGVRSDFCAQSPCTCLCHRKRSGDAPAKATRSTKAKAAS